MSDISDRNPPDNNHYKKPSLHKAPASVERLYEASGDCHRETLAPDRLKHPCGASRHVGPRHVVLQEEGRQEERRRALPEAERPQPGGWTEPPEGKGGNGDSSDDKAEFHHESEPAYFISPPRRDQADQPCHLIPEALYERVHEETGWERRAKGGMHSSCIANGQRRGDHADSSSVPCRSQLESRGNNVRECSGKGQTQDICHDIDTASVPSTPIQYHEPLDVLVEKMTPMIRLTARRLKAQSRIPMHVDMEDLIQAGTVGLLEASQRFNPKQGAAFETYAIKRIQGAMVDELRSSDWLPRSLRRHAREAEQIHNRLEQYYGGPIRERDVAAVMEVSLNTYNRHRNDVHNCQLLDYTDYDLETFLPEEEIEPLNRLLSDELHGLLQLAIASLDDEREREALTLYRLSGNSLRMIGERMGVSDSRVCQLHKRAMAKIRAWFQQYFPELEYIGLQGHGDLTSEAFEKPVTYRTYSFKGSPLPPREH